MQSQSRVTFRITLARVGRGNWSYDVTTSDWPVSNRLQHSKFCQGAVFRFPSELRSERCDSSPFEY